MASLTGTKIKDTYDGLLKTTDNGALGASAKQITDGLGTGSPIYVSTTGVGIGTGSLSANLHLSGSSDVGMRIKSGASSLSYIDFDDADSGTPSGSIAYNNITDAMTFATGGSNSERMRITSGGDVFIGTQTKLPSFSPDIRFVSVAEGTQIAGSFVNSSATTQTLSVLNQDTSGTRILVDFRTGTGNGTQNGQITSNGTSVTYGTSSDYRLKENVVPMTGALDRVAQLKPSRFNFIADPETTVDGFLAHEVQEVIPEAATGVKDGMREEEYEVSPAVYEEVLHPAIAEELDEEGNVIVEAKEEWTEQVLVSEAVMGTREVPDYQGIDQSKIVPLLVGAIQELTARLEALEA